MQLKSFFTISANRIPGKLLRFPLKFIPKHLAVPILQGELKGKKWIVGAGTHGCWLGSYEYEKQSVFARSIKKASVVYDVGAHAGLYTLLASQISGPEGKVYAFEPAPANINFLKEHLSINQCNNVTVIEALVSDRNGESYFSPGINSYSGHLASSSPVKVQSLCLDTLLSDNRITVPDVIKIDVEGAEVLVLSGAKQVLADFSPLIFLATHGTEIHRECCSLLKSLGYILKPVEHSCPGIDHTSEIIAFKKGASL